MKTRLSYMLKATLLLSVLCIGLLLDTKISYAAQSGGGLDGIKTLKSDTVYKYDLNGDGKTEKIMYKVTNNDDQYTTTLKLYINDKLCMAKQDHGFSYNIQICDLNKKDKNLDLYGYATQESDCISYSFFAQYKKDNTFKYISFNPKNLSMKFNTIRYSLYSVQGDGKFTLTIDTPVFSDAIGCYNCYVPYQVKNGKFSMVTTNTYTLTKYSKKYQYKAKKSFSVYDKVGSKTVLYNVKKDDIVTFDKIYISKTGKVYCRATNKQGKSGWIKSEQKDLFIECPMWG